MNVKAYTMMAGDHVVWSNGHGKFNIDERGIPMKKIPSNSSTLSTRKKISEKASAQIGVQCRWVDDGETEVIGVM